MIATLISCGRTLAMETRFRSCLNKLKTLLVVGVFFKPEGVEFAVDGSVLLSPTAEAKRCTARALNGSCDLALR